MRLILSCCLIFIASSCLQKVSKTVVEISECSEDYKYVQQINSTREEPFNLSIIVNYETFVPTEILFKDESGVPRVYHLDKSIPIDSIDFEWYDKECHIYYKSSCDFMSPNITLTILY